MSSLPLGQTDTAIARFRLWFFRELTDHQRLALLRLLGLPVGASLTLGQQSDALARFIDAIRRQPQRTGARPEQVRERESGSTYTVLSRSAVLRAASQPADTTELVVYRAEDDDTVWVQPLFEFDDGRFEPVPAGEVR